MKSQLQIQRDLTEFRTDLADLGGRHGHLLELHLIRPVMDIAVDWTIILGATLAVVVSPAWLWPIALVVVANRQRALGNILHDAGHCNLSRDRRVNDLIASCLVAPMAFSNLKTYRETHVRHHQRLGDPATDPDFIGASHVGSSWRAAYLTNFFNGRAWLASLLGDLASSHVALKYRVLIVGWWVVAIIFMAALLGADFVGTFALLWLGARATAFHAITTFREMCDHVGLRPGGIFSYTRDVTAHGPMRWLIHPRNNGYHLTHHLVPAIPYYRLPEAHVLFRGVPSYQRRSNVCSNYLGANGGVVGAWSRAPGV